MLPVFVKRETAENHPLDLPMEVSGYE